ncbi:TlpA disulfide reductase family protein [Pedobacter miscanthi]|uniref:TlpA disulfide reductase family protein n=1 Tax=Pedobacter miscanthi TaxID=2259170 RepID=UPI0029316211|nr:TlpA disulfide reductase family protein [Pedobacter miscanthi]
MKKYILIAFAFLPMVVMGQKEYKISGTVRNFDLKRIYLNYSTGMVNAPMVTDSAEVIDGKYAFKGRVGNATFATLKTKDMAQGMALVVLSPEQYIISHEGSLSSTVISGSKTQSDFENMKSMEKEYAQKAKLLTGEVAIKALEEEKMEYLYAGYIKKNPGSPLALYALTRYASTGHGIDVARAEPLFRLLPKSVQNSYEGEAMAKQIRYTKTFLLNSSIGSMAKDFSLPDTSGETVSLSAYRGKYVLLDFWASWCAPCREDNPHLKSAYSKYKPKGFEILSVSLDVAAAKKKWLKAIHDDGIGAWTHIADLQSVTNKAVELYGVQGIPQNFLIDPSGKIVAMSLRGGALEKELAKIFEN